MGVVVAFALGSIHYLHDSLSEIWITIAILQVGRLLGFMYRYYVKGSLVDTSKSDSDIR